MLQMTAPVPPMRSARAPASDAQQAPELGGVPKSPKEKASLSRTDSSTSIGATFSNSAPFAGMGGPASTNALSHEADIAKVQEWLAYATVSTTRR
jgi:hypothetical protein